VITGLGASAVDAAARMAITLLRSSPRGSSAFA
jgi:hypothetical protein